MISPASRLRLRPSVAFVPLGDGKYQFFQGNTRRSRAYRLEPGLAHCLQALNGLQALEHVAAAKLLPVGRLVELASQLSDCCLLEDAEVATRVAVSPWRRSLNFLADYFPSSELEQQFERLRQTPIVIVGAGAVGGWIAVQLVQIGFRQFTIVDDDHVERSNLNRALFLEKELGKPKAETLADRLYTISHDVVIDSQRIRISDSATLRAILEKLPRPTLVVNCADSPSVDVTSDIVDSACQSLGMPYVIAGGYNLHLSLIGMTVIPGESACYHCGRMTLDERQASDLDNLRKLVRPWRNVGNIAPLAAITSSFAANEVVRLAVRSPRLMPKMLNRRGEFNFLTNQLHFVELPRRDDCGCAGRPTVHRSSWPVM